MKRKLNKVFQIPLMGWMSLLIFLFIPLLLLLGSFSKVNAQETAGSEVSTPMALAVVTPVASDSQGQPGTSSRTLNPMTLLLFTFLIAIFLGVELISKVPSQLHTPLMSGSNAISGITVVGACIAAGQGRDSLLLIVIGVIAMICAMINVAGGYLVTDRMLRMFKGKERK